jgi:hypothetical protein
VSLSGVAFRKCRSRELESNLSLRDIAIAAAISARNQESYQDQQESAREPGGGDPQVSTVTVPASASEAMDMVRAGLGYLAAADATAMAAAEQARYLRMLEQANSVATAAARPSRKSGPRGSARPGPLSSKR